MFEIVTGCKGILVFSFLTGVSLVYYNSYIRPESTKNDYNNFSMIDHEMGQVRKHFFRRNNVQRKALEGQYQNSDFSKLHVINIDLCFTSEARKQIPIHIRAEAPANTFEKLLRQQQKGP